MPTSRLRQLRKRASHLNEACSQAISGEANGQIKTCNNVLSILQLVVEQCKLVNSLLLEGQCTFGVDS